MSQFTPADDIAYLVGRRFPGLKGTEAEVRAAIQQKVQEAAERARRASELTVGTPPTPPTPPTSGKPIDMTPAEQWAAEELRKVIQRERDAATYRKELLASPRSQIAELLLAERKKEAEGLSARRELEERNRFYNLPTADADFQHYCKLANWTLDEAVALSLGKQPTVVNWKSISPFTQISPLAKEYEKRREVVSRAKWAQQLFDPVLPSLFLKWARTKFDPLPEKLLKAAIDDGISLTGWGEIVQQLTESGKAQLAQQRQMFENKIHELDAAHQAQLLNVSEQLKTARQELDAYESAAQSMKRDEEIPLKTRERENLQLMGLFGAIRGYGYDPASNRNTATTAISKDFGDLGMPFSDDRVRDHLKAARDLLPGDWMKRWRSKPYTGKP